MSDFDVHYPAINRTERRSSLDLQPNNGMNSKGAFDSEEGYKCEQAQRFSAALSPMAKFLVRMSSFSGKLPGSKERDMDDLLMKDGEDLSFVSNYMYSTPQFLLVHYPLSNQKICNTLVDLWKMLRKRACQKMNWMNAKL